MSRRLIAIGIAVVLSTPFIPFLRTSVEHLIEGNIPVVVPGQGWKLEDEELIARISAQEHRELASLPNYKTTDEPGDPLAATGSFLGQRMAFVSHDALFDDAKTSFLQVRTTVVMPGGFAQIRSDGGWKTAVILLNLGQAVMPPLSFYADDGNLTNLNPSAQHIFNFTAINVASGSTLKFTNAGIFESRAIDLFAGVDLGSDFNGDGRSDQVRDNRPSVVHLSSGTTGAYTSAFGINDSGQVVGTYETGNYDRAFLWSPGTLEDLSGAYLSGADLRGADLREANLRDTDLRGTLSAPRKRSTLQIAAEEPEPSILTEHVDRGWYALDLPRSTVGERIDLEFASDEGKHKTFNLTKSRFSSDEGLALIYFRQPGALRVSAAYTSSSPTLREATYAELINRARDNTALARILFIAEVSIDFIVMCLWIPMVCFIQWLAYIFVGMLPRNSRGKARRQVDRMVTVAEWGGMARFSLLMVKDLLIEIGIVAIVFVT